MNDPAIFEHRLAGTGFTEALDYLLRQHCDTATSLHQKIVRPGEKFDRSTISTWRRGTKTPRTLESFEMLRRVEDHYGLRHNFLRDRLPHQGRSPSGHHLQGVPKSEARQLAWHLPDDFAARSAGEQAESHIHTLLGSNREVDSSLVAARKVRSMLGCQATATMEGTETPGTSPLEKCHVLWAPSFDRD